jgi:proteasome lid subunit RPN8/RPN11
MLRISPDGYDLIRRQAELSYPNEGCGILLGTMTSGCRTAVSIFPSDNNHPEPRRHYSIDPKQVIAAQKLAREQDMDIIGFYHSHPDHPAQHSETDLAEAYWLDCSYVITSVEQGQAVQTLSFFLSGSDGEKFLVTEKIEIAASS